MHDENENGSNSKGNPGAFNLTAESFKAGGVELPSEDEGTASAGTEARTAAESESVLLDTNDTESEGADSEELAPLSADEKAAALIYVLATFGFFAVCIMMLFIIIAFIWEATTLDPEQFRQHPENVVAETKHPLSAEQDVKTPDPIASIEEDGTDPIDDSRTRTRWEDIALVNPGADIGHLSKDPGIYRNDETHTIEIWHSWKLFPYKGIEGSDAWHPDERGVVVDEDGLIIAAAPEEIAEIGEIIDTSLGKAIVQDSFSYKVLSVPVNENEAEDYTYVSVLTNWG